MKMDLPDPWIITAVNDNTYGIEEHVNYTKYLKDTPMKFMYWKHIPKMLIPASRLDTIVNCLFRMF
uniref:CSON004283 protein n=1 Tax=Culicoides sonorensis TaxID=179676 RepID=A0A336MNT4_CULSO